MIGCIWGYKILVYSWVYLLYSESFLNWNYVEKWLLILIYWKRCLPLFMSRICCYNNNIEKRYKKVFWTEFSSSHGCIKWCFVNENYENRLTVSTPLPETLEVNEVYTHHARCGKGRDHDRRCGRVQSRDNDQEQNSFFGVNY